MLDTFNIIFEISTNCNRNCNQCCNKNVGQKIKNIDLNKLEIKLSEINSSTYLSKKSILCITLTGGEPFLYKAHSGDNIESVIKLIKVKLPNAKIIIKSTGWAKHEHLNKLLEKLYISYDIKLCLGFNLFQNDKTSPFARLLNMIEIVFQYQDKFNIDSIYYKKNIDDLSEILAKGILKYSSENKILDKDTNFINEREKIIKRIKESPNLYKNIKINLNQKSIDLTIGPAYQANLKNDNVNDFYIIPSYSNYCNQLKYGINSLFYSSDLTLYPCNCPFIDFSYDYNISSSFEEEYKFIEEKYFKLKKIIDSKHLKFDSIKDQCHYCSQFIANK